MPVKKKTSPSRRPAAKPAISPETQREIEEDRLRYRDYEFDAVVDAALTYHAELQRTDRLHQDRLSSRWHDLLRVILACAEAHRGLRAPVTKHELEMHEAIKRIGSKRAGPGSRS